MSCLCVYILWPSSIRLATGPGIGWDVTIIIFRKRLHMYLLKISSLIIILLLLMFIDVITYYISCVFICYLLNYFVFFLCPCSVSVIGLWAVVSSAVTLNN